MGACIPHPTAWAWVPTCFQCFQFYLLADGPSPWVLITCQNPEWNSWLLCFYWLCYYLLGVFGEWCRKCMSSMSVYLSLSLLPSLPPSLLHPKLSLCPSLTPSISLSVCVCVCAFQINSLKKGFSSMIIIIMVCILHGNMHVKRRHLKV